MRMLWSVCVCVCICCAHVRGVDIHVDPAGDDSNAGTLEAPLRTLAAAQQAVRQVKASHEDGVTVYLHGGTFKITETLVFTPEDSGSVGAPIVWRAFGGETPVISGGVDLTDGWRVYRDGVFVRSGVSSGFRQLYIDGRLGVRARTPNGGLYYRIRGWDQERREIRISSSDLGGLGDADHLEIVHMMNWAKAFMRVSSVRTESDDAYVSVRDHEADIYWPRAFPKKGAWGNSHQFYFENALGCLDAQGEWYLDTQAGELYYRPRDGEVMGTTAVMAPGELETLVRIEGEPGNPVAFLEFHGLIFESTNWTRPNDEGALELQAGQFNWKVDPSGANNMWVYRPPAGIMIRSAQGVRFVGNVVRNMGACGIDLEYGTERCEIVGNVITQTASNGISIGRFTAGLEDEVHGYAGSVYDPEDIRELSIGDIIANNYLYQTAQHYGGCAIAAGYTRDIRIRNNEIEECAYTGISVGYGWTTSKNAMEGNLVARNRLHRISTVLEDSGAIYTLSRQPGTKIVGNVISDVVHGHAIYLDEGSGGTEDRPFIVSENVLGRRGRVHTNQPGRLVITGNVATRGDLESEAGLEPAFRGIRLRVAPE